MPTKPLHFNENKTPEYRTMRDYQTIKFLGGTGLNHYLHVPLPHLYLIYSLSMNIMILKSKTWEFECASIDCRRFILVSCFISLSQNSMLFFQASHLSLVQLNNKIKKIQEIF